MSAGTESSDPEAVSLGRIHSVGPSRLATVCMVLVVSEFLGVATSADLADVFYQYLGYSRFETMRGVPAALTLALLVSVISLAFRQFVGVQRQPMRALLWNGLGSVALAFSFFLSALFLFKVTDEYSRGAFIFQVVAVAFSVCSIRATFYVWLQAAVRDGFVEARKVILIGDERYQSQFPELVKSAGFRRIASLPFPHHRSAEPGFDCAALIDFATARRMIEFCRSANPDDIVILSSQDELPASPELARLLSELPVNVHIVPLGTVNMFGTSRIAELGDLKTLQVSRPPLSTFELAMKRAFDIIVALTGLILLAPLLVMVGIAIKIETPGSIFFRQKRHGYNKSTINVIKFRTMVAKQDDDYFVQAKRNDSRVTHIGRMLRRANIDELPQLFNVLMGDMSIVGPRPHATAHNEMFEGRILPFSRRHNIKPGITGWAQVNGHRGETDTLEKMQRRVEHDLYYIDNWSILLDLQIILLTFFSSKSYVNAY
jgi:Undecaprenyl-phosphate glucose phosphotransferase